ncbi:DUF5819 family protein [Streptomyces sp. NPDC102395]|uniref:DUF5819 family protein n=1 Tax=Streptomyces sp. NPDC102395 TaxID=3366168 RepID=UPI0038298983
MDAYDGGTDAPREAEASRGPDTGPPPGEGPRATGSVPRPRAEAPGGGPAPDTEPTDRPDSSEPVAGGPGADSPGTVRSAAPVAHAGSDGSDGAPVGHGPAAADPGPRAGVAALSTRYRIAAALAVAVVAVAVCVHVGMVFLHVAPANTVTKTHGEAVDDWVYPEFEQNWKLFAPNPLQQNIAVQVRADIRTAGGERRTTGWYDLSVQDGRDIDGNLLPSHTQQNELRRAWDFYTGSHDAENRSVSTRSALSESYLRRIVVLRLDRGGAAGEGGVVERVQVRSRTTDVRAPGWSGEKTSSGAAYRVLPWWPVEAADTAGGAQ